MLSWSTTKEFTGKAECSVDSYGTKVDGDDTKLIVMTHKLIHVMIYDTK